MRYSFILNLIININVFINLWGQSVFDYMNQELPGNTPVEFFALYSDLQTLCRSMWFGHYVFRHKKNDHFYGD